MASEYIYKWMQLIDLYIHLFIYFWTIGIHFVCLFGWLVGSHFHCHRLENILHNLCEQFIDFKLKCDKNGSGPLVFFIGASFVVIFNWPKKFMAIIILHVYRQSHLNTPFVGEIWLCNWSSLLRSQTNSSECTITWRHFPSLKTSSIFLKGDQTRLIFFVCMQQVRSMFKKRVKLEEIQ